MLHKFQPHETAILAAFQKAMREGEFDIPLPTSEACVSLRARAYSVSKRVKTLVAQAKAPASLLEPIGAVSLTIEGTTLKFRRKDLDPGMAALIRGLGGPGAIEQVDTGERELDAMAQRVQAAIQSPSTAAATTADGRGYLHPDVAAYLGTPRPEPRPEPAAEAPVQPTARGYAPDGALLPPRWAWDEATGQALPPHKIKNKDQSQG